MNRSAIRAPGPEELHRRVRLRAFERLVRVRRVFAPVLLGFALWIGLTDDATWRRITMLILGGGLAAMIIHDFMVARRPSRSGSLPRLELVALVQHAMIFASGAMLSPVLPLILPLVFLGGLLNPPRTSWTIALAIQLPALWIEAGTQLGGLVELTPTALAGHGPHPPTLVLSLALAMSVAVVMTTLASTIASDALARLYGEALDARDAALASRADQARQLTTLSAEIAHELKNPLASVKGLAALIERGELPGKAGERLAVLRREVDRMHGILDEFLNFSRPLVPLDQRELELRELVERVVELHEGLASEREVSLELEGHARLRCDPRKVEQVLINLVQNALEVAPPRSTIAIELRDDSERGQVGIVVRDAGPGLDEAIRERVFEAGVTGKPAGSGLGLTIARALARQHAGELELGPRGDGEAGCEASLWLPRAGIPEAQP